MTADIEQPRLRASAVEHSSAPLLVISPPRGFFDLRLSELWQYRELFLFFAWRDIKVRYKQTALGIAWAVLQPLLAMLIFTIFFGRLAKIPSDGVPYPVFSYSALVPWTFFATALTTGSTCLVVQSQLLTKVYFPRLVMPTASVLAGLVDLLFSLVLLLVMLLFFGITPARTAPLVLPLAALGALTALGISLWISALNVRYRDFGYTVPFLIQLWMFASPVVYSSSLIPNPWRALYGLNPMATVIEGFRWALLGTPAPSMGLVAASLVSMGALMLSGMWFFGRMERTFGEVV